MSENREKRQNKNNKTVENELDAFQRAVMAATQPVVEISGVEKAKNTWLARRHTIMNTYDDDDRKQKTLKDDKDEGAGDEELDVNVRKMADFWAYFRGQIVGILKFCRLRLNVGVWTQYRRLSRYLCTGIFAICSSEMGDPTLF